MTSKGNREREGLAQRLVQIFVTVRLDIRETELPWSENDKQRKQRERDSLTDSRRSLSLRGSP
jgi:hypothetical protein